MKRSYKVVDVFTRKPLLGNPVAVVLDAEGLDTAAMQKIANWTNLSETTFVLPPTNPKADYRLRIFTPRSELPFAGHPTLGSAHALLEAERFMPRGNGQLVQQCNVGLVELSMVGEGDERKIELALPPAKMNELSEADATELSTILNRSIGEKVAPAIVDVGPKWVVTHFDDAKTVLNLKPDFARLAAFERRLGVTGLLVFGTHESGDALIEVRAFAPSCGVDEDPVCGSGNGCAAVFQRQRGLLPPGGKNYVAAQGQCVGRAGRVEVGVDAHGNVRIGGACVTCVDGTLTI
jgi:PhzF family phenazine biosynthesis protein